MVEQKVIRFSVRMVSKTGFFLAARMSLSFWYQLSPYLPSLISITSFMFLKIIIVSMLILVKYALLAD